MKLLDSTRTDSVSSLDAASAAATASEGTTVTESSPTTLGKSSRQSMCGERPSTRSVPAIDAGGQLLSWRCPRLAQRALAQPHQGVDDLGQLVVARREHAADPDARELGVIARRHDAADHDRNV